MSVKRQQTLKCSTYCKIKEKVINKCLAICIGISKYDKDVNIADIEAISNDMETYIHTFKNNKNYANIICNQYNKRNTKKMLDTFFRNCLISELLDESDNIQYNSLMITISAHCTESGVICSDGGIIQFTDILSIFTASFKNKNLTLNLPKFMIIDGDRGLNDEEKENLDEMMDHADIAYIEAQKTIQFNNNDIMDTYSAIFCSKSLTQQCSKMYSGQLSWNLCAILQEFENRDENILFYDIINILKRRLDKISNYQLTIKFIEHDMDIDDVLFPSNSNNNGFILKLTPSKSMDDMHEIDEFDDDDNDNKSESNSISSNSTTSNSKWMTLLRSNSQSLHLLSQQNKNKNQNETKIESLKKALTPKLFLERAKSFTFTEDKEIKNDEKKQIDIIIDHDFIDSNSWNKSLSILSKNNQKTKIKMEWLFIYNNKSHSVELYHSQRINPYEKTRKILNIDGKQIFSEKTTATQFTQIIDKSLYIITIGYNHNDNKFNYHLKINNKSHKQLFNEWNIKNLYIE